MRSISIPSSQRVCLWSERLGKSMWSGGCVRLLNPKPMAVAMKDNRVHWVSPLARRSTFSVSATPITKPNNAVIALTQPQLPLLSSTTAAPPFINVVKAKNPPQLALLSLLFVLSTAIGAVFSLAVISIPTMIAFKKLGVSADKLSKIVSEEVPGTLSSLKLSGLEINELTEQLSNLRQKISGIPCAKKSRSKSNKPTDLHM